MKIIAAIKEGRITKYQTEDGEVHKNFSTLGKALNVHPRTLMKRIALYGPFDERISYQGKLKPDNFTRRQANFKRWQEEKSKKTNNSEDFRPKCKRSSKLCKHYIECQNARLGLPGAEEWNPPANTDECYEDNNYGDGL